MGDYVVADFGWVTHAIARPSDSRTPEIYKMPPEVPDNMRSLGLGVLGKEFMLL